MRRLGQGYYGVDVLEQFMRRISTMDDAVVAEGNYVVAIDVAGTYVGSGGWSQRKPGYAAHGEESTLSASLTADRAIVRSVFVDPGRARAGIGSSLMAHIEEDAQRRGIRQLDLTATLSGVDFYRARGYRTVNLGEIDLGVGVGFGYVEMTKLLAETGGGYRIAS